MQLYSLMELPAVEKLSLCRFEYVLTLNKKRDANILCNVSHMAIIFLVVVFTLFWEIVFLFTWSSNQREFWVQFCILRH